MDALDKVISRELPTAVVVPVRAYNILRSHGLQAFTMPHRSPAQVLNETSCRAIGSVGRDLPCAVLQYESWWQRAFGSALVDRQWSG